MNAVWNRALALSLLTVGAVGGMSGAAWATPSPPTPITIVNPSFEANNPGNTARIDQTGRRRARTSNHAPNRTQGQQRKRQSPIPHGVHRPTS